MISLCRHIVSRLSTDVIDNESSSCGQPWIIYRWQYDPFVIPFLLVLYPFSCNTNQPVHPSHSVHPLVSKAWTIWLVVVALLPNNNSSRPFFLGNCKYRTTKVGLFLSLLCIQRFSKIGFHYYYYIREGGGGWNEGMQITYTFFAINVECVTNTQ